MALEGNKTYLRLAIDFLREIGLTVAEAEIEGGFVPHVRIFKGTLLVDPRALVSDLLHEAGHLAITPSRYRHLMDGDLRPGIIEMIRLYGLEDDEPDSKLYRAVVQASDDGATAWAFAAGVKLQIPHDEIISGDQYGGDGETIRACLAANAYIGINGLSFAGFCSSNRFGKLPVYPNLAFWTQEL
ncbi:MAG: hypothetical protein EOP06_03090 [Proteobacteria bacterium]|nr:MAG: hypothetical protein EOP06_03090 [Pseudomonadota bacterium]